jgi:sulfane dehydrogenase subunit SoxC
MGTRLKGARGTREASGGILKPLPGRFFVDHRGSGLPEPEDPTCDMGLNAEMRWEAMAQAGYLTPVELFFVRNHAPTPRVDPLRWRLRVEGPGVRRALELGYEDLLRMSGVSLVRALECAGNGRAFFTEEQGRPVPGTQWRLGAVGVAEWTGVPLRDALLKAGLRREAREVMLEGLDACRMRRPLPLGKALEEDTLLAYGMNGEPLLPDHGHPLRAVVPGWAAVASVKWLGRIYVSDVPMLSPWNTSRYVLTGGPFGEGRLPVSRQVPKSALELPWPARLPSGRHVITGRSWSPSGGIRHVKYSLDGRSWRPAELFGPNIPRAWARWRFVWEAGPGRYRIRVRATDTAGNTQPDRTPPNDLGYLYGAVIGHPVTVEP